MWFDLTQTDIDSWEDPPYAAKVSQPFDIGCLARATVATLCPKLLSNPITLQEIPSGHVAISTADEQRAKDLAAIINSGLHS
jgi:hypothetical protein